MGERDWMMVERRYPLAGLSIVEVLGDPLGPATRLLAELGADVIHLAAPGQPDRLEAVDSRTRAGLRTLAAHAGKHWVRAEGPAIERELARADVILHDASHPLDPDPRWSPDALARAHPNAILITCSDFGTDTPFVNWQATDPVLHALSGQLSRSGIRGKPPLLPPGELAFQCAAAQLAYIVLLAVYHRQRTGRVDRIDFSALDGAVQALDPGYGINGSATMGRPARLLSPERPAKGIQYPIFRCADGLVRIYIGAARQWRGMFEWMGKPGQFASPDMDRISVRLKSPELNPAIAAFFAPQTRAELEAGATRHGVPLSAMIELDEAVQTDHIRERGLFTPFTLADGTTIPLPAGVLEIDHARMDRTHPTAADLLPEPGNEQLHRPLDGLKVLDLGVIVVGGESSRLLADNGADVIKLESRAFPDGTRQTDLATGMAVSLAAGHRNKRSLGLDLRAPDGKAIFERMVAQADVVLTNFKPGTMASLGLGYDDLRKIRPDLIMVESSAFGSTGPWHKRMGYGPLVRAATGLAAKWCYPGEDDGHSDSLTIYPDHVAARIGVIGVLALLIDRARSKTGGLVGTAQCEIALAHQAWEIAASASARVDPDEPEDAPWGVFQTAGDDDWCVVTSRGDADWQALATIVPGLYPDWTRTERLAHREAIEATLGAWLADRNALDAMETLQRAGVPAAKMLRVSEQPEFAYFRERGFFRVESHPHLAEPYHTEAIHVRSAAIPDPDNRPAPLMGEHTIEVMRDWLDLPDSDVDALIDRGVLQPVSPEVTAALAAARKAHA
ncbi:MAG: CoA transferase [Novosphingobium sp.]